MIKLVASDLDVTIIDKNNLIFSNNFKAFDDLHKHNMNFVVCTGKTYPITKKMCSEINAKFGIFGNGNLIMDLENEKVLENMSKKAQEKALEFDIDKNIQSTHKIFDVLKFEWTIIYNTQNKDSILLIREGMKYKEFENYKKKI